MMEPGYSDMDSDQLRIPSDVVRDTDVFPRKGYPLLGSGMQDSRLAALSKLEELQGMARSIRLELDMKMHKLKMKNMVKLEEHYASRRSLVKELPQFWHSVLTRHPVSRRHISGRDRDVLGYLDDISCHLVKDKPESYTLRFTFSENPFFPNENLEATVIKGQQDDFGERHVIEVNGTEILWRRQTLDPSIHLTQKKMGSRSYGVTTVEPVPSFFRLFTSNYDVSSVQGNIERIRDIEANIQRSAELLDIIKDSILPKAITFFTGKGLTVNALLSRDYTDDPGAEGIDRDDSLGWQDFNY